MGKQIRKDGWTPEEDKLLGDTVIDVVKNGETQLEAFKKVADQLGRTHSAVAFRWNSEVRRQYADALLEAKRIGKSSKTKKYTPDIAKMQEQEVNNEEVVTKFEQEVPLPDVSTSNSEEVPFDIDALINFLYNHKSLHSENEQLRKQVAHLQQEKNLAEQRLNNLKSELGLYGNDFEALLELLRKARDLSLIAEKKKEATTV